MDGKSILIVIASLKFGGGAERVVSILATGLQEKGHDVHVLTFYTFHEEYRYDGKRYCLHEKMSKNILLNSIKLLRRAYVINKYCRTNNIQASISFMEEANFPNILSTLLSRIQTKTIVCIRQSIGYMSPLYQKMIRCLYPHTDLIITNSKEEQYNLVENYGFSLEQTRTIYNPIDIDKINKKRIANLGTHTSLFSNGKFTFITVGRLSKQKNQRILILTFDKLYKENKDTQLIIIGSGELESELQSLIKSLGNDNIHMIGQQKNIYNLLDHANCFVLSSLWEGFPNVLLEALACDLPIISTDCPTGPQEILFEKEGSINRITTTSHTNTGILIENNNKEELFKAMKIASTTNMTSGDPKKYSLERTIKKRETILLS